MRLTTHQVRNSSSPRIILTVLWIIYIAIVPLKRAFAYVDPNSVGPLYQFLFPLIVAITSAIAGFRRAIAALWNRLVGSRTADARAESASSDAEPRA
jgi:CBS domain containing-hemolysin-like protein